MVDTHIHVWDLSRAEYPWLKNNTSILNRTYEIEELEPQRKAAGVTAGVLIQAANNAEDTANMIRTAENYPWIKGIVGWLPLLQPAKTAQLLETGYAVPGSLLKGVRHLIHDEPDPQWLLRDTVLESLGNLAKHDIPYDLVGVLPAHIETALKVAERHPDLKMVFDHFNQPPIDRTDKTWENGMKTAASHANFYVKLSGLGTAARKGPDWNPTHLEPCIEFALHHFTEDRCFLGGDWPVSLLAGSYEKTIDTYRTVIKKYLDPKGQEKLFWLNAERFYKLPI